MNYFIEQLAGMGKEELLFILAGMGEERGLQCFVGKQLVQCLCHLCCVTDGCQQSGTPLVQNFAWSCGAVGSHDELAHDERFYHHRWQSLELGTMGYGLGMGYPWVGVGAEP